MLLGSIAGRQTNRQGGDRGLVVIEASADPMGHSGMAWIAPNGGKGRPCPLAWTTHWRQAAPGKEAP